MYAYSDFVTYSSGVYARSKGAVVLGAHAVKMIGWGTTSAGVDYWLVANLWGEDWGEGGFARIRRGVNECGIEVRPRPSPHLLSPALECQRLTRQTRLHRRLSPRAIQTHQCASSSTPDSLGLLKVMSDCKRGHASL